MNFEKKAKLLKIEHRREKYDNKTQKAQIAHE